MDYVNDANELVRRLRALAFGPSLPAPLADKLQRLPGSEADVICDGAETLYAYRDQLGPDGLLVLGELYTYALHKGWTTFNADGRSAAIVALARRDLGETGPDVAAADAAWPAPQVNRRDGHDWREAAASVAAA